MKRLLALICVLLTACSATIEPGSIQPPEECPLPMEYAIRSSCPFTTAKIDGECTVVCYEYAHAGDPSLSKGYPVQCEADSDCSCDFYASNATQCGCVNNICAAIMSN